jgi:hypothetical protein
MKATSTEFDTFNRAMDTILKAKPEIVKRAMELEKEDRAKRRKAKRPSAVRVSISPKN